MPLVLTDMRLIMMKKPYAEYHKASYFYKDLYVINEFA